MPGGVIQLVAIGSQDIYLTINPQITYFKNVFKRHTNFSMEFIELDPSANNKLNETSETKIEFKIDRNGDLFNNLYFIFTLPDIFSNGTKKFQWIHRIGEYIIKEIEMTIGSSKIDTIDGRWIHIWRELTLDEEKKEGYNKMIGNVEEIYNPLMSDNSYAASTALLPSILSRKIIVPIPFWFASSMASSVPLIALQKEEIKFTFTLRPFNQLYTIVDSGLRKKSPSSSYNLGTFSSHSGGSSITTLDIVPKLEVNYLFIDKEERKKFAEEEHHYIINQVQRRLGNLISPKTNKDITFNLNLDIQQPVSNIIWVVQRTDYEKNNQFHNYTNWADKDKEPRKYDLANATYDEFSTIDDSDMSSTTFASLKYKHLVKEAVLKFNGVDRFKKKDFELFSYINNYQHSKRIPEDGIYVYSFNLENKDNPIQPNGSCNFSRINNSEIELTLIPSINTNYQYNIHFYIMNFNFLRILSGMGSVQFSN